MKLHRLLVVFLLGSPLSATLAADVSCPDLATAVQVGACPAEEELRHTFNGYCSDNARTYKGDSDVCTDYRLYRTLKNVALWESADGNFNGYVSCDRPLASVKSAKISGVRVGKQGKMTQFVCSYGEGVRFTFRTRAECKIDGGGDCKSDAAACKAKCE
ncbi:MAG: hypothetical protein Q8O52_14575 [Sulfuritalea sp.]|nr:hypothetical protein [Sulfuritalea sp.]